MPFEKTIARAVSLDGVGLQTGQKVRATLRPAESGTGIRFVIIREGNRSEVIRTGPDGIAPDGALRRSVVGQGPWAVETVEHLMAALYGLGVTNCLIEVEGTELPGLDGSSIEYVRIIRSVGTLSQDRPCEVYQVRQPLFCSRPEASLAIYPAAGFRLSYTLDYPHSGLEPMFFSGLMDEDFFVSEVAPARTSLKSPGSLER